MVEKETNNKTDGRIQVVWRQKLILQMELILLAYF